MKIGIIGAGPRGILLLDSLKRHLPTEQTVQVEWFDAAPTGGNVWDPRQDLHLIMNSPAQLVTLFNDYRSDEVTGPTFYQWTQLAEATDFINQTGLHTELVDICHHLQPNDYAPRALFGAYAQWVTAQIEAKLPANLTVTRHHTNVVTAIPTDQQTTLKTADHQQVVVDQVVLSTGNTPNQLSRDETSLRDYANQHQLTYVAPTLPATANFDAIQPNEPILIRGLGLSFFDYLARLTSSRGGQFVRQANGQLEYQPSGREPQIIAGSRRGVPYYPKPINQEQMGEQPHFYFLNDETVTQNIVHGQLSGSKFIELLRAEIELRYYQLLLADRYPDVDLQAFTQGFVATADRNHFLNDTPIQADERLNWEQVLNPVAGTKITTTAAYQQTLLQWMDQIMVDAALGSKHAPLTGALSLVIELRPFLQHLVVTGKFAPDDYIHSFLQQFNATSGFLTAGPPLIRYQQLAALMRAGIVTILGPQLRVVGAQGHFMAFSHFYPQEPVAVDAVLEARVPATNLAHSASPILQNLAEQGLVRPARYPLADGTTYTSGAIDVQFTTYQAIKADGQLNSTLFVWGLPLSGKEWMTTALPHPLAHDHNFGVADQIATTLFPTS
ncbi:FAD/NAD(P)-binding protein [Fructilactobacillus cliffordii]|uniref:FAD/NAD(P)-binding protein n=1 Tax=Fructilactobacillus cliffordii TaxID=2940299 RepID=A0A9Q9E2Z2_9LACO|nr:FAD/NAD(P)-binding domain-containing protein [Fructilactobacillus cliffordii]USS89242.1 FAD/NAD(P)-binding protein [Fructilactobacillus cliffordii]